MHVPRVASAGVLLVVGVVLAGALAASVPGAIFYQGVLLDPDGQPRTAPVGLRFRIFRGGDGATFPSAGVLVYHEHATVTPAEGAVSHLIGTGAPAADCASGPCVLDAAVFGPGQAPTWIEVTIDPDGLAGTSDDEVLLPRNLVGTVGYTYRAGSVDGAEGGAVGGSVSVAGTATAATLAATTAITGPNVTSGTDPGHTHSAYQPSDPDLDDLVDGSLTGSKVEAASEQAAGTVTAGVQTFAGWKTFSGKVTLADETTLTRTRGFVQQAASTFPGGQFGGAPGAGVRMRSYILEPRDAGSDAPGSVPGDDTELIWLGPYYNALITNPLARENPNDYSLGFQFAAGWTHASGDRRAEYFLRHVTSSGSTAWNPFAWNIIHLQPSGQPKLDYTIRTSLTEAAFQVNDTAVAIQASPVGKGEFEVSGGSGTTYLGGSTGGRLKFEGTTNDAFQLEVTAQNPTATRTQQFPDAFGDVQLAPTTTENAGTMLWGGSDAATSTGNEVCALAGLTCVAVMSWTGSGSDCVTEQGLNAFYAMCRS